MRGWLLAVVLGGCYHPAAAFDVPCSAAGTCPDNQMCDTGQSPPRCVATITDAGTLVDSGGGTDSSEQPPDAPPDAPSATVPIAFVQARTVKPTGVSTMLGLNGPVLAHDAIILCLNFSTSSGATLTSVTDTLGNTYQVVVGPITSGGELHYVAIAHDTPGGSDTITITLSASVASSGSDLFALEYSGLRLANAFDVFANQSGTTTAMSSGTASTTTAHELVLGYAEASAATSGAGFTGRATLSGNLVEDEVVTTTGAYVATATTTGGSTWTMIMATFKGQ